MAKEKRVSKGASFKLVKWNPARLPRKGSRSTNRVTSTTTRKGRLTKTGGATTILAPREEVKAGKMSCRHPKGTDRYEEARPTKKAQPRRTSAQRNYQRRTVPEP